MSESMASAPAARASMGQRVCILVVAGDPVMRYSIVDHLENHNMHAIPASGRHELTRALAAGAPNLAILDLQLGQGEGLDLLRTLRSRPGVPVIITTGHRREEIDRAMGAQPGVDGYVIKPFSPRELLARIRAVLRRGQGGRAAARTDPGPARSKFGGWQLDRLARRLTDPAGAAVALTTGEYALLAAFLDAPQRPLTREHLLQATRVDGNVFDRSIDVQILRLRRKLQADPGGRQVIQTERGVGYSFALPVEPA